VPSSTGGKYPTPCSGAGSTFNMKS
jgi:hypothetical protein